jgi:hypothetical protein
MRQRRKQSAKGKSEDQTVTRLYKNIHQSKVIYERWVAGTEASIATGAGGTVALTTVANAAIISSTSDFASIAVLYTAYRCKAIRVEIFPANVAPYYNGTTNIQMPAAVAFYPWTSNNVPTTFQQALDVTGLKLLSGYKQGVIQTSWRGDPDAHLWTATGSAIGSSEQFGISCIGTGLTATATATVYRVFPMYLVQFRMAG